MTAGNATEPPRDRASGGEDWAAISASFGWRILRARMWIIGATLLLALFAGFGITRLSFNADTRVFFGPSNPERLALDNVEAKYAKLTNMAFVVAPRSGTVFEPRFLKALAVLTEEAWQTPFVFRVDSLANYQELRADNDVLDVRPLYDGKKPITPEVADEVRTRALASLDLKHRLVAAKGDAAMVSVLIARPNNSRAEVAEVTEFSRALAQRMRTEYPDIEFRLTGALLGDQTFAEAGKRDVLTLVPVMAIAILAILALGIRSVTVTLGTSIVITLTVIIAIGVFGWFGAVLNTLTAAAPAIIMLLFFADCVHFVLAVVQQQSHGLTRDAAIAEAIRINSVPVLIKTATTIIGFLALNFGDSPPIWQLGNMVALGSLVGCILTLTFMPALLSLMPLPVLKESAREHVFLSGMAGWITKRAYPLLIGFALVTPLFLLAVPSLRANDDFIRYFDSSFEYRRDTEFMEQRIAGAHMLSFSMPSGATDGVTDPKYLRMLDRFAEWYRTQPNVAYVSTLADVVRRLNKAMNNDDPAFDTIPDDKALIAQYLFLYEMALPQGHDLTSLIDVGRSESMVSVRLNVKNSSDITKAASAGQAWMKANIPPENAAIATGVSVIYSLITSRNMQAMAAGTAISVLVVSLIMWAALRDWRLGIISLLINLTPAGIAFGLWSMSGATVNLAATIVTAMCYGIVTDDTVHTITKYRWARTALGMSPVEAVREVLTYTGGAVILSSVALSAGMLLLGLSGFNLTALMGTLSALIVLIAMVAELLALPGLLLWIDRRNA